MKTAYRFLALLLVLCLTLGGCSGPTAAEQTPDRAEEREETPAIAAGQKSASYADDLFSLNYDPVAGLDPYRDELGDNALLMPLLYEGLFHLTPAFDAEAQLCESWTTEDGLVFQFKLKQGVQFSDGTPLTATEAAASINRARVCQAYAMRLKHVLAAYVLDGVLFVELDQVNYNLPVLLDLPIVHYGGAEGTTPFGTGPYQFARDGDVPYLKSNLRSRLAGELPLERIYLRSYEGSELITAFDAGLVDLVSSSRAEVNCLDFAGNTETRSMDSTLFFFLGVNGSEPFLSSTSRRTLLSSALDRESLCQEVTGGVPVTIPLNPAASFYSAEYDPFTIRKGDLKAAHVNYLVEDYDEDGWLDYIEGELSIISPIDLELVVNKENPVKVELAKVICRLLTEQGYRVSLRELAWEDYLSALKNKNYDLYLGEIRLSADFDLTELLGLHGVANFCVFDPELQNRIDRFNGADSAAKADAARSLFSYIAEQLPIISLLFEQRTIYTHRETVLGIGTAPHDIFNGIEAWEVKLK